MTASQVSIARQAAEMRRIASAMADAAARPVSYVWVSIGLPQGDDAPFVGMQSMVSYQDVEGLIAEIEAILAPFNAHPMAGWKIDLREDGPADWGTPLMRENGYSDNERSGLVINTTPCDSRGVNTDTWSY